MASNAVRRDAFGPSRRKPGPVAASTVAIARFDAGNSNPALCGKRAASALRRHGDRHIPGDHELADRMGDPKGGQGAAENFGCTAERRHSPTGSQIHTLEVGCRAVETLTAEGAEEFLSAVGHGVSADNGASAEYCKVAKWMHIERVPGLTMVETVVSGCASGPFVPTRRASECR
jgi:hypothetical protein